MKNNKGFTLTELVAVLVILVLLMTMAYPNFANLSATAKSNYDNATKIIIRSAASMYVNNNKEKVDEKIQSDGEYCVPIGTLIAYEYLDAEIHDVNDIKIPDNRCVLVTMTTDSNSKNKYSYDIQDKTETPKTATGDFLPPLIKIKKLNTVECSNVMNISQIDDFYNNCQIEVTDNVDSAATFQILQLSEEEANATRSLKLDKMFTEENNKIFVNYSATDSSGNKAIPLQIQLVLPE